MSARKLSLKAIMETVPQQQDMRPILELQAINNVQPIKLSGSSNQAHVPPPKQDEPSISYNPREHSLLHNFPKDNTPISIPLDGEDSHKVGQSIYYKQQNNYNQFDSWMMQTNKSSARNNEPALLQSGNEQFQGQNQDK